MLSLSYNMICINYHLCSAIALLLFTHLNNELIAHCIEISGCEKLRIKLASSHAHTAAHTHTHAYTATCDRTDSRGFVV